MIILNIFFVALMQPLPQCEMTFKTKFQQIICIIYSPLEYFCLFYFSFLDIPGHFDRNGFIMDTPEVQLKFYAKSNITTQALKDALTVRSYTNSLVSFK